MPYQQAIMLGVVGDSAAGKTTITQDIARILGEDRVTVICTDDYHRYNRLQRHEMGISALDPDCNYMDIMSQHLDLLRRGHAILKPIYNHSTGDFDPPEYIEPREYIIVEGLLAFATRAMRRPLDIKVYLAPDEDLRIQWKIKRDTAKRGYTEDQVKASLEKRASISAKFITPQQQYADIVVKFYPPPNAPQENSSHLNAQIVLRPTGLPHPDLSEALEAGKESDAFTSSISREEGWLIETLGISGGIDTTRAEAVEEAIWAHLPELERLKPQGFGEYQDGIEVRQSHPLALTQLLMAYHMLQARKELEAEIAERRGGMNG